MRSILKVCALASFAFGMPAALHAATVVSDSNEFESLRRSSTGVVSVGAGVASTSGTVFRSGTQTSLGADVGNGLGGLNAVYWLTMPLLAPGESLDSATFSVGTGVDNSSNTTPEFNGDLYSLGFR